MTRKQDCSVRKAGCAGPGAYTPQNPESSHKKHRTPDVLNPSAVGAIAALQAKLRSTRRAATGEAHLVDEVLRATLKFGAVQAGSRNAV